MKKPKGFFTYFHLSSYIEKLSDAQAGRLYKALLNYGYTGEVADLSDDLALDMAYILMRDEIDMNFERYSKICEKRSEAGKKGGRPRKSQQTDDYSGIIEMYERMSDDDKLFCN